MRWTLKGLPASPGTVVGPAWWYHKDTLQATGESAGEPEKERERLQQALAAALAEIEYIINRERELGRLNDEDVAIFEAQRLMLQDPELAQQVDAYIRRGMSAAAAWQEATEAVAQQLAALPDPYFQARAADVRDIGQRVLAHLLGTPLSVEFPEHPVVVLADDLMPSDTVRMDTEHVLAFCTARGGPTSHAAILARRLNIPAIVGLGEALHRVRAGQQVLVDGDSGVLVVEPSAEEIRSVEKRRARRAQDEARARQQAFAPAITVDGFEVDVGANIGNLADAQEAVRMGADGVGLLRTEFLYLERNQAPTEEEQAEVYRAIFSALEGRPVVVRTLDVGGDKPLPYLPLPAEANPFLGMRAIRLARKHPELLRTQLRAILRAGAGYPVRIMFPMVATVAEMRWLRSLVEEVAAELRARDIPLTKDLQVGMMVEIPSAAILAERFCPWVDFFSVGTNDLSQYTLAADRTNAEVAALADGLHPAVLWLIRRVVEAAHAAGRWVGVCGEIAGEEIAVPVLLGLGVDELSMSPNRVPRIKALIRRVRIADAQVLAQHALTLAEAEEVRALVTSRTADFLTSA